MTADSLEIQTRNALDFVQKLFFEISYLIKEVEGLLQHEEEEFEIGRPSGYGVTSGKSTGLEPVNVESWLGKSFTVFFVPKADTRHHNGQTITEFKDSLKLILLDIQLEGKKDKAPRITAGTLYNIKNKKQDYTKFEHLMFEFVYNREKLFATAPHVNYEDSYMSLKGELFSLPLFSMKSSDDVMQKIVVPMLKGFRGNI